MINAEYIKTGVGRPLSVKIYDRTDSTNLRAKEYAVGCCEDHTPVLFIAREQSAGRGRLGRQFLSRADSGIYMSLLYFTDTSLSDSVSVTTAAAVLVAEALENVICKRMMIKWVNDVYSQEGKVCGILTESIKVGEKNAIIVGIGINTGNVDFPEELKGIAATVGDVNGRENEIIAHIVGELLRLADDPVSREYMTGYRKRFMLRDQYVTLYSCGEAIGEGKVLDVTDDGGLVFLPDGKTEPEIIRSGEVTVRRRD